MVYLARKLSLVAIFILADFALKMLARLAIEDETPLYYTIGWAFDVLFIGLALYVGVQSVRVTLFEVNRGTAEYLDRRRGAGQISESGEEEASEPPSGQES